MKQTKIKKTADRLSFMILSSLLFAAAFLYSFSVIAAEDDTAWYIGTALGQVTSDRTAAELGTELTSTGVNVTNISVDDSRIGWKLNVGFDITRNVAIEAGYMDLNDVSVEMNAVVSDPELFFNNAQKIHPNSADGFTLGSVYRYNITDNIGLTGSVGLFNWEGDFSTQSLNTNQTIGNDGTKGTDLYFGVGGGYQLSQDVTLSIEWEQYQLDNDKAEMWSIGLNYHFK
ncbi:MAG: porin family protein [Psychrosphaera sp.]|nr:porin family protein [Psychrosphaera sp.]